MEENKDNKVYDTDYFKKQGSKGGRKVRVLKKDDPDFYKRNGIKGAKVRWGNNKINKQQNERTTNNSGQTSESSKS